MKTPDTDATISICNNMTLVIKEVRGSSTMHSRKEGFEEVSHNTYTYFHWKLRGMTSSFSLAVVKAGSVDMKKQEIYGLVITSETYDIEHVHGFKTREHAIRKAVAFAKANGIEIDGYGPSE